MFHCWLIWRDPAGIDHVLLQKRAVSKEFFPGAIDVSVGGRLLAAKHLEEVFTWGKERPDAQ